MAGVTDNLKNKMFYKGQYININPITELKNNPNIFDYIDSKNSTFKYIELMKSFISSHKD